MTKQEDCKECGGYGWVWDYLGGCGDPECCGGPYQVKCTHCDNDWDPLCDPENGEIDQEYWT